MGDFFLIVLTVKIIQAKAKATSLLFLINTKPYLWASVPNGVGVSHCIIQADDQACSPSLKGMLKIYTSVYHHKDLSVVQDCMRINPSFATLQH